MYWQKICSLQGKLKKQDDRPKEYLIKNKLLLFVVFGIVGILLGLNKLYFVLAFFIFGAVLALFLKKYFLGIVLVFVCLCFVRTCYFVPVINDYKDAFAIGQVFDIADDNQYILCDVSIKDGVKIPKKVRMYYDGQLQRGDIISFEADFYDPFEVRNIGDTNYRYNLLSKGIVKIASCKNAYVLQNSPSIMIKLNGIKDIIDNKLGEKGAILKGIIFGDKSDIDDMTYDLFTLSGTNHILAVSGLHVGIVFAFVAFILRKIAREIRNGISIGLLAVVLVVTGFSPSVVRASIMMAVYLLPYDPF